MSRERSIQRFGEKLHALRTMQGLTLTELAHRLGHVAHGYISELEAGKKLPGVEFVLSVARLFDVTTDELLRDELELRINNAEPSSALNNIEQRTGEENNEHYTH